MAQDIPASTWTKPQPCWGYLISSTKDEVLSSAIGELGNEVIKSSHTSKADEEEEAAVIARNKPVQLTFELRLCKVFLKSHSIS
ncbi:rCG46223 [Rattus norvegicus]|uniref:RCG46223 n=1 Tax=Rattus norvegicus TaxID=10116 RepID=A6ICJ8_RAT|nr:rCG46223 [Rattus norvegicus]